jgi:hypothetical protein
MSVKETIIGILDRLNEDQLSELLSYAENLLLLNDDNVIKSMEESERLLSDPNVKTYKNFDEILEEINRDDN